MATIHELSEFKKAHDYSAAFDREAFKRRYKKYLMLESKLSSIPEEELNAALKTECESILSLLPEDGLDSLHTGEICKLCADDGDVRRAELYATTDMGHERENEYPGSLFGAKHGYSVPVFISCCKRCRRNYRLVSFLPTAVGIFIALSGFVLMCVREIREPLASVFAALPFIVYIGVVGVAMLVCALIRGYLLDRLGEKTEFNITAIDKLRYMKVAGWVSLYDEGKTSKLVFHDTLPDYMRDGDSQPLNRSGADSHAEDA